MNGAQTGMAVTAVILKPIRQVLAVALAVSAVAVAGTAMRGTAALRAVATTLPAIAAASSGSALPSPSNNLSLCVFNHSEVLSKKRK